MMKFLLLILLAASALAGKYEKDGEVYQLTDDNFDEFLKEHPVALVKFYAPWCGHCKALAPKYKEAAEILVKEEIEAVMAELDATEHKQQPGKFGVRGYPTLKVFLGGVATDYQGAREVDALVDTLKKYTGPAVEMLETHEAAEEFLAKAGVKIFGVFPEENKDSKVFVKKAEESRAESWLFGLHFSEEYETGVYVDIDGEEERAYLAIEKKLRKKELDEFITANSTPLLDELGPENYQKYKMRNLPLVFTFVDLEEDNEELFTTLRTVAKEVKGKISVTYLDGKKYAQQATRLALSGEVLPALAVEDEEFHYAYPEDAPLEVEPLTEFMVAIANGEAEPTIKSEEIPETQDEPVYKLVAKAFNDVVFGQEKDVFVKYYAPWCGHCKKLAPIWETMAKKLSYVDTLIIADFDATANDAPANAGVRGFPTLVFYPAGSEPGFPGITFKGERELEDLIEFVEENAAIAFDDIPEEAAKDAADAAAEEVI